MTEWGIGTLFNPGQRHVEEEKRRLQSTREEVGDNSGGQRIDFDMGKVVIKKKVKAEAEESDATEVAAELEDSDPADADTDTDTDSA